jgi:hypothetical protein
MQTLRQINLCNIERERMTANHPVIRAILREHSDGLTVKQLADLIPATQGPTRIALKNMPDAYIYRWAKADAPKSKYEAVWAVVVPPEDCPRPATKGEMK